MTSFLSGLISFINNTDKYTRALCLHTMCTYFDIHINNISERCKSKILAYDNLPIYDCVYLPICLFAIALQLKNAEQVMVSGNRKH